MLSARRLLDSTLLVDAVREYVLRDRQVPSSWTEALSRAVAPELRRVTSRQIDASTPRVAGRGGRGGLRDPQPRGAGRCAVRGGAGRAHRPRGVPLRGVLLQAHRGFVRACRGADDVLGHRPRALPHRPRGDGSPRNGAAAARRVGRAAGAGRAGRSPSTIRACRSRARSPGSTRTPSTGSSRPRRRPNRRWPMSAPHHPTRSGSTCWAISTARSSPDCAASATTSSWAPPVTGPDPALLGFDQGDLRVATAADAIASLTTIVTQGEGSSGAPVPGRPPGHFQRFLTMQDSLAGLSAADQALVSWPCVANPVLRDGRPEGTTKLTDPASVPVGDIANRAYRTLWLLLGSAFLFDWSAEDDDGDPEPPLRQRRRAPPPAHGGDGDRGPSARRDPRPAARVRRRAGRPDGGHVLRAIRGVPGARAAGRPQARSSSRSCGPSPMISTPRRPARTWRGRGRARASPRWRVTSADRRTAAGPGRGAAPDAVRTAVARALAVAGLRRLVPGAAGHRRRSLQRPAWPVGVDLRVRGRARPRPAVASAAPRAPSSGTPSIPASRSASTCGPPPSTVSRAPSSWAPTSISSTAPASKATTGSSRATATNRSSR